VVTAYVRPDVSVLCPPPAPAITRLSDKATALDLVLRVICAVEGFMPVMEDR
jgi:hypothetical protein